MPKYDYRCNKCRREFELVMGIQEHDRSSKKAGKVRCPKCDSSEVTPLVTSVFVTTSKKS